MTEGLWIISKVAALPAAWDTAQPLVITEKSRNPFCVFSVAGL